MAGNLEVTDPLAALQARQMQAKQLGATTLADQRMAAAVLSRNKVLPESLQKALLKARMERKSLMQILVEDRMVEQAELPELNALAAGVLFVELGDYRIPSQTLQMIPGEVAKTHQAVPFRLDDLPARDNKPPQRLVWVALANPQNAPARRALEQMFAARGYTVRFVASSPESLRKIVDERYFSVFAVDGSAPTNQAQIEEEQEEDSPARRLYLAIFGEAMDRSASDVHLETLPDKTGMEVRMRIDGVLQVVQEIPERLRPPLMSYIKLKVSMDIAEQRRSQSGRAPVKIGNREVDIRAETLPTVYGETLICRLLSKDIDFDLQHMGFSDYNLERYERGYNLPYGSVLVTGPTGSGKSSTLYATLTLLNEETKKVITIEDPVEYRLRGIQQVAVDDRIGRGFSESLRSIMRSDPDIIMVGEIRDDVTAQIALRAANTGHLMLSTLHVNEAAAAPVQLLQMKVPPYLVAEALSVVVAQRLTRRLCGNCKERYVPDTTELLTTGYSEREAQKIIDNTGLTIYQANDEGCPKCTKGYKGRVAIHEVLLMTDEERRVLMSDDPSISALREVAIKNGMRTMKDDGLAKVFQGITSFQDIRRVIAGGH